MPVEIRVVQTETDQPQPALSDEDRAIIPKGLPERADFEAFLLDFQQNREDRPLPGWYYKAQLYSLMSTAIRNNPFKNP
ncbi:MAG: hypothetical protein IT259_15930 [Saprospiraceae bacterium]|nr:hypothetical protein [Saprospiraceae bacterium]